MINDASWEGGSTCWFLCNKICSNYLVPYDIFFGASVYACPYINHPRIMPLSGRCRNFEAKVVSVGWEADCAVLTVENDEFWQDIKAVQLSKKARCCHDWSCFKKSKFKVSQRWGFISFFLKLASLIFSLFLFWPAAVGRYPTWRNMFCALASRWVEIPSALPVEWWAEWRWWPMRRHVLNCWGFKSMQPSTVAIVEVGKNSMEIEPKIL